MTSGVYKRTKPSARKGIKHTSEALKKMSESHKGCIAWNKGKRGEYSFPIDKYPNAGMRGKKLSKETRKKLSSSKMGNKNSLGHISPMKGKKHSDETKQKMSKALKEAYKNGKISPFTIQNLKNADWQKRENNARWISDRSKLKKFDDSVKDRRSSAYSFWRRQVWLRDNFKCKIANTDCSGRLEAHHILGWTEYPELRYNINNGITLCHAHHPRKRAEEKRLIPTFMELVSVSN